MLKKRIIPVLLLNDGRMAKGVNFSNYRDTGDPKMAVRTYSAQDADELAFININRKDPDSWSQLLNFLNIASKECFMPMAAGGGICSVDDIRSLLNAGADKVIITTSIYKNPGLITEAAKLFGSQCVVAGIDYRYVNGVPMVSLACGTKQTSDDPLVLAKKYENLGAGELLLTCIDNDGRMLGYDLKLAQSISNCLSIPVIVSGGAGTFMHLAEAFQQTDVAAVACASLFHFGDNNPIRARSYLKNLNIPMRVLK